MVVICEPSLTDMLVFAEGDRIPSMRAMAQTVLHQPSQRVCRVGSVRVR